jgi:hypothetical protein
MTLCNDDDYSWAGRWTEWSPSGHRLQRECNVGAGARRGRGASFPAEKQRSREARQNLGWDWIVLCVGCQSMEWVVGSPLCKPTGGELSGESISADAFVLQWAYRAAPRQTRPPDRGLQPHPNYHIRPSYGHKATRPDGRDIRQPTTPNQ